ncbi:glycosyltransferase [Candidatus Woesearchaeota archaeon]|nr:glycosyltransferase [Candidatus Woesearchaeota archaeon]
MPTLSLCMITKNEEQFIEESLNSVRGFVDEIIIVDTGSTDKTKEIAKRFTNKIYDFIWNDNFSAPRNEALKHATGDWILVLDADEILPPESKIKIKEAMESDQYAAYFLPQVTFTNIYTNDPLFIQNPVIIHEKTFAGYTAGDIIRLFQNQKTITYDYFVHETVEFSLRKQNLAIGWLAAPFLHLHELKEQTKIHGKQEYYAQLSLKNIEKYPTHAKNYHDISIYYHVYKKDEQKALEYAEKAVRLEPNLIEFRLTLSFRLRDVGRRDDAITVLLPLLKLYNDERVFVELGDLFAAGGNAQNALTMYKKAAQLNTPRRELILKKMEQVKV